MNEIYIPFTQKFYIFLSLKLGKLQIFEKSLDCDYTGTVIVPLMKISSRNMASNEVGPSDAYHRTRGVHLRLLGFWLRWRFEIRYIEVNGFQRPKELQTFNFIKSHSDDLIIISVLQFAEKESSWRESFGG